MSGDPFDKLTAKQVADWYHRLAEAVGTKRIEGQVPLASTFLKCWLNNRSRGALYYFTAPGYLKRNSAVLQQLKYHRSVFLTEQPARIGRTSQLKGVIPRIKGSILPKLSVPGRCDLNYKSLVSIGSNQASVIRIMNFGSPQEKDLFTSLRGFQLRSDVIADTSHTSSHGKVRIDFRKWTCVAADKYDFAANEHLTVPNPDFGSRAANAVSRETETITVNHKHAIRVEKAGLAAVCLVRSRPWDVIDPNVVNDGLVDTDGRNLLQKFF